MKLMTFVNIGAVAMTVLMVGGVVHKVYIEPRETVPVAIHVDEDVIANGVADRMIANQEEEDARQTEEARRLYCRKIEGLYESVHCP